MTIWDTYPASYRHKEVENILSAVRAGDCVALVGLSGSGKSNLLGFLANRVRQMAPAWALADCNRMDDLSIDAFYRLILGAVGQGEAFGGSLDGVEAAVRARLAGDGSQLCILFDRFDALSPGIASTAAGNLRFLRDEHKYTLSFVIAARRPPDPQTELGELFFAHTLWLGPLAEEDARWSIGQFTRRHELEWDESAIQKLIALSGGYPAWLRAACEAYASGAVLEAEALRSHPAVHRRLAEFWADKPAPEMIAASHLEGSPLIGKPTSPTIDTACLTAKEALLLSYMQAHPALVCEKDDLIRAVWPEDRVFIKGIRDDSLAQLMRRLREKIETDPSTPRLIHTVPGRGYRYMPG